MEIEDELAAVRFCVVSVLKQMVRGYDRSGTTPGPQARLFMNLCLSVLKKLHPPAPSEEE